MIVSVSKQSLLVQPVAIIVQERTSKPKIKGAAIKFCVTAMGFESIYRLALGLCWTSNPAFEFFFSSLLATDQHSCHLTPAYFRNCAIFVFLYMIDKRILCCFLIKINLKTHRCDTDILKTYSLLENYGSWFNLELFIF